MKHRFLFSLLVLLHAFLLVHDLTADPPVGLDDSLGIWTDEGWKTYAARNKAIFGDWQPREGLSRGWIDGSPLPSWIWYGSFRLFGVSRAAARFPNLVFSIGTMFLLYALARRAWGERAGVLTAVLYVLDWNVLMFARLALQETQVAFWLLAALYCWCRSDESPLWGYALGLTLTASLFSKASAAGPVLAFIAAYALELGRPGRLRAAMLSLATLAGCIAVSRVLLPRPILEASGVHMAGRLAPIASWTAPLAAALVLENGYMTRTLPVFLAALGGAILTIARFRHAHPAERVSLLWLAAGLAMFAVVDYRPARYFPILAPPLVILAGSFAHHGLGALRASFRAASVFSRAGLVPAALAAAFLGCHAALKLAPPAHGFLAAAAAGGLLGGGGLLWFAARSPAHRLQGSLWGVILAAAMGFFATSHFQWARSREHRLAECGRTLAAAVPPGATLGGYQAVMLALETCAYVGDVDNPPGGTLPLVEKLRRVRPDHLATTREEFDELPAAVRASAVHLADLPLMPPFASSALWRIDPETLR